MTISAENVDQGDQILMKRYDRVANVDHNYRSALLQGNHRLRRKAGHHAQIQAGLNWLWLAILF